MSTAVEKTAAALEAAGFTGRVKELGAPAPTAAAAAEQLGCEVGAIANSLVFTADGAPLLVLASGAHRVDTKKVAALLGVGKIKRASPDLVFEATGQRVGGVAPVGHPAPLRTVLDNWLAAYDVVWAGGGDENTMFSATADELVALTGAIRADVA